MEIDGDLVRRVARLAALELAPGEETRLALELSRVLDRFEAIRSVPEELLPPLPDASPVPLRADVPASAPGARPWLAANAPATAHGHFVVPRVVSRRG